MVRITIDRDLCIGFGNCVKAAPEVFELDEDDIATVRDPTGGSIEAIRNAEAACPTRAIIVVDAEVR